jgi:hypothetical protein
LENKVTWKIKLLGKYRAIYVSVTGIKPKGLIGWIRFLAVTIPASRKAQQADGMLLCEFNSRDHFQHTLTVWESKDKMLAHRTSPAHLRAMNNFSKIGRGKVYGYETEVMLRSDAQKLGRRFD